MRFEPQLAPTLALGVLACACAWLGAWQLERAEDKRGLQAAFENPPTLDRLQPGSATPEFARLTLRGRFDPERHVLVDNRVLDGSAGVHVLTPFRPASGGPLLLVNRGWLPLPPDRAALPEVTTPTEALTLHGHLGRLPQPGLRLGEPETLDPAQATVLVTYPDQSYISAWLGEAPHPQVLYLDATSPGGFAGRDWRPVVMTARRHTAYAVQWFALAATAVVAWVVLAMRAPGVEPGA